MLLFAANLFSQTDPSKQATGPTQFDFWVGDWDLSWQGQDGKVTKGTNSITREFDGFVIRENFKDPDNAYFGMSVSVYDTVSGKWKQTWVDSQGAYLDFLGEFKDGKMILSRSFVNPKGVKVSQRMIFYNIKAGEMDWDWENSKDDGKTWNVAWQIHYVRRT